MTDPLPRQPWMDAAPTTKVLDALEAVGGPACARFVGGCVRNTLIGCPIDDIDIACALPPDQVVEAARKAGLRCIPTGIEHGTVTLLCDHQTFEVTTLRRDVETDGRHAVVAFSDDWAQDAARRDFRLNALYADREGRIYDYSGHGVADALEGRVVFVGDADTRIREDYLRILRFFRFQAWYGRIEPEPHTLDACARGAPGLDGLSAERMSWELLKLMAAPEPQAAVRAMAQAGVLARIVPEGFDLAVFDAMAEIDDDPLLRLSTLLPDSVDAVTAFAKRLRLSRAQKARLLDALPGRTPISAAMDPRALRQAIYRLGRQAVEDQLKRAWARDPSQEDAVEALLVLLHGWRLPHFPLGGEDAAAAGAAPGPGMGRLLRAAEDWWVENDFPDEGLQAQLKTLARSQPEHPA